MTTSIATKNGEFNHLEYCIYRLNAIGRYKTSTRLINTLIKFWT